MGNAHLSRVLVTFLPEIKVSQLRHVGGVGSVHVFNDEATLKAVTQAIIELGEFTGVVRGHERYGLYFAEPVGYRVSYDGSRISLYYAEMKVKGNKYHVIPRTKPS